MAPPNCGAPQFITMIMAWLDNELDAPIAKETWKNLLYMLSLLPVNDPEYGSLDLGVPHNSSPLPNIYNFPARRAGRTTLRMRMRLRLSQQLPFQIPKL